MHLPRSSAVAGDLVVMARASSTNSELAARFRAGEAADLSVLVTTDQSAGRGRLGRSWVAPAGHCLAASVLLDLSDAPVQRLAWVPLLAGAAMARAVASLVGGDASLERAAGDGAAGHGAAGEHAVTMKWPNDVLIGQRKVSGILCEVVTRHAVTRRAVVVGAGLNLTLREADLPTPTATSLLLHGVVDGYLPANAAGSAAATTGDGAPDSLVDAALAAWLTELTLLRCRWAAAGFDPVAGGLASAVEHACGTIGRRVRVELPGGGSIVGRATGIDGGGQLVIAVEDGGRAGDSPQTRATVSVAAGDVTHLRHV